MSKLHTGSIRPENTFDVSYAGVLRQLLENGFLIGSGRTADSFTMLPAMQVRHDMRAGFPLTTLRKLGTKFMKVELLGFLRGITDKSWYQKHGCRIWDEWCNPTKVAYSKDDPEIQAKMAAEMDLGPIYGKQLRDFRDYRINKGTNPHEAPELQHTGVDQLTDVLFELKKSPFSRRLVVSYWNPTALQQMALPTCHFAWQLMVTGKAPDGRYILSLEWRQRSTDIILGTPTNMVHYALLLWLICELPGYREMFTPGQVIGDLGHTHIYSKHIEEGAEELLVRKPFAHPTIRSVIPIENMVDWDPALIILDDYQAHPKKDFTIAI